MIEFTKKDGRKKYICVIDVETACGIDENGKSRGFAQPLIYDLGFAITDKKGNVVYKKSFLIKEIFLNQKVMSTAYYVNKVPMYWIQLHNGEHELVSWNEAIENMFKAMEHFNVQTVMAYNLNFDKRAINCTNQALNGVEMIFDNYKQVCIWSLACETIFSQKSFPKIAVAQGWYSDKGNLKTNAEICYRYISGRFGFIEDHTGLSDVLIEVQIMAHCYRQRKAVKSGILGSPWQIPNKLHKDYTSRAIPKHQAYVIEMKRVYALQNAQMPVIDDNAKGYQWGQMK